MIDNVNNKYMRRALALIFILLLIFLASALWYVIDKQDSLSPSTFTFFQSILTTLIASIVTSAFMGVLYWWLLPKKSKIREIEEIGWRTTRKYFREAVQTSSSWGYHGHIGRWIRNDAIPELVEKARETGEMIDVSLVLIDPTDDELCSTFSDYRNTMRTQEEKVSDSLYIKAEIYATILKMIKYSKDYESITIKIFLSRSFGAFRKDISDNAVFMTRVDTKAPALFVRKQETSKQKRKKTLYTRLYWKLKIKYFLSKFLYGLYYHVHFKV